MNTSTVAPGSPVPVIVGVASTVKLTGSEAGEALPSASVWVAVTVWSPSVSGSVSSRLQVPSAATVVVPTTAPSMVTVTVAPGSPVPVIVGVLSFVISPSVGDVITGAAGAG